MISVTSIVVIACALALSVQGQNVCTPADTGVPTAHQVHLQELILQPYVPDWTVTVPQIPECVKGIAGVHADVCDGDLPPQAYFANTNTILVHRTGSLVTPAVVRVVVYCVV